MVDEIWSTRITVDEIHSEHYTEQEYDGDGGSYSTDYWEEIDSDILYSGEFTYVGEEDEIQNEVLLPALITHLQKHIGLGSEDSFYVEGDSLEYKFFDAKTDKPLYRVSLG